ncbi:MAG: slipin family protein [Cyanobacteria bacterium J06643_5]
MSFIISCIKKFIRVNFDYENSVIFRLGKLHRVKRGGIYLVFPLIEKEKRVDLRTIPVDIESQDTVTRDSVTVGVNAVLYYHIKNPAKSVTRVRDYEFATVQVALTTLRNVIGQHRLDELLQERDQVNLKICQIVDEVTDEWGIEIERIEIKNLEIPKEMQRAMAKEAEAAREKRARMIKAESEYESTIKLKQAAHEIDESPVALELRRMQMIAEIGTEQNTTTLLMIPSHILSAAKELSQFLSSKTTQ